jgi:hypothetical protein
LDFLVNQYPHAD